MPFIAGAGVMGVAVGFAAKDTSPTSSPVSCSSSTGPSKSVIASRCGVHRPAAPPGEMSSISGCGPLASRTTDNIVVIIPNNEIMTRDIVNYTTIYSSIRVRINIGIAYDADLAKAKSLIIHAAGLADWILAEPAPKVVVRNFGESSVDLQARVWIKDARRRMDTIDFITDTVKTLFDDNGIEIPFPKRDITIVGHGVDKSLRQKKDDGPLD
jgi:small-conductance mechanosensitive channel